MFRTNSLRQFESILEDEERVVVAYTAKWDIASRRSQIDYTKFAKSGDYPFITKFVNVDVDLDREISEKYHPKPFPVWHIYENREKIETS